MSSAASLLASVKPPAAINYFYDEAKAKLSSQVSQIDALDTKPDP